MEYGDIEVYTRYSRYTEAADLMLVESLQEGTHELSAHTRDVITKRVATVLEQNHHVFSVLGRIGYNPMRIAQEACKQTCEDLGMDQLAPDITLETEPPKESIEQELDKTSDSMP